MRLTFDDDHRSLDNFGLLLNDFSNCLRRLVDDNLFDRFLRRDATKDLS